MHEIIVNSIESFILQARKNIEQCISLEKKVYVLEKPLKLNGINRPLIINGNNSTFVASKVVLGEWQKTDICVDGNNVWKTEVDANLDVQCLFVNGESYNMARYPNFRENEILGGYSGDSLSPNKVKNWSDPTTGYVRAIHTNEWGGNSYKIVEKDFKNNTLKLSWVGDNNRGSGMHKNKIMVENIFEELDCPKEWFYDAKSGALYVIPEKNIDLNNSKIEYGVNSDFLIIENCSNITIKEIAFEKSNRTLFNSKYIKITRSDWCIAERGAVYIENSSNIILDSLSFKNVGGNCIFIKGKNENIWIENNLFTNCGASGVCVFGDQNACRDLSTWENHKTEILDTKLGSKTDNYPKNINVLRCYFCNLGLVEKQSAAVTISVAEKVTVKGCTVHRMPRAGINICDGCYGGHLIEDNDIFDTVRETGDHGPFNSWGRDRFWSYKKFDTSGKGGNFKRKFALLDAYQTVIINHNRIVGDGGFGIDLDDGSTNYTISNNICYGVGIKLREGFLRNVSNNIMINAPLDLHATFCDNDDIIENNIVMHNHPINLILFNKGATTKLQNNLFSCKPENVTKNVLYRANKNSCRNMSIEEVMSMNYIELPKFVPISLTFGVENAPKPHLQTIAFDSCDTSVVYEKMLIRNIDESALSLCGLPDYNGAYVEKISIFSRFYRLGVRKGDAILLVNGEKIFDVTALSKFSEKIASLTIQRNQKQMTL